MERSRIAPARQLEHAEGRGSRGTEAEQREPAVARKGAGGTRAGADSDRRAWLVGLRPDHRDRVRLWFQRLLGEEGLLADQEDLVLLSSLRRDHYDEKTGGRGGSIPGLHPSRSDAPFGKANGRRFLWRSYLPLRLTAKVVDA